MASSIMSLHDKYKGEKFKPWQISFSWALKSLGMVTVAMKLKDACSFEGKLWQGRVLKSRVISLQKMVHIVKGMVFLVVMYRYESWTIKKAELWRIDAFELKGWTRLLRVPWTARRSNQSILRKSVLNSHWKDWCWSWSSNTLVTWCKKLIHWKRPWCRERLKAKGKEGGRGWSG